MRGINALNNLQEAEVKRFLIKTKLSLLLETC